MFSFLNKIKKISISQMFLILFGIGFMAYIGYTIYNENSNIPKEYFVNSNKSNDLLVTFYSFSYCGFCKKFNPIWEETKNNMKNSNVSFRKIEVDTLKPEEKSNIPYFVNVSYAPCVILTHNNKNIKEFDQQIDKPMRGLDKFIESKGDMYYISNSKNL